MGATIIAFPKKTGCVDAHPASSNDGRRNHGDRTTASAGFGHEAEWAGGSRRETRTALTPGVNGEEHSTGGWETIGDAAARVVARLMV